MAETNDSGNTPDFDPPDERRPFDPAVTERLDTVFELLRNARRRALLSFLHEADEQVVSMDDAVAAVVASERAKAGTAPDETEVRADLYHAHLPRLADAGVLEYDPRQGDVRIWDLSPFVEWLGYTQRYDQT